MYFGYLKSPIGILEILCDERAVFAINFANEFKQNSRQNNVLNLCLYELNEYFKGNLKEFNTPVRYSGTEFMCRVYDELFKIPYANTITYKELAKKSSSPLAYRAVANANAKNKIPIIVPCHRVVSVNGIGGYSGFDGIKTKQFLLNLEKANL